MDIYWDPRDQMNLSHLSLIIIVGNAVAAVWLL